MSYIFFYQVAHMTKNEMQYLDSSLIGPAMLFLNQYFNFFIKEYYVLWLCFVSCTLFISIDDLILHDLDFQVTYYIICLDLGYSGSLSV